MPAASFPVGVCPVAVALASLDGGTKVDLIIVRCTASVGIFRGNGDGTFQGAQDFPVDVGAVAVAISDFNGDGKLDLAVVANNGAERI
jgi:VCBS repeat protein